MNEYEFFESTTDPEDQSLNIHPTNKLFKADRSGNLKYTADGKRIPIEPGMVIHVSWPPFKGQISPKQVYVRFLGNKNVIAFDWDQINDLFSEIEKGSEQAQFVHGARGKNASPKARAAKKIATVGRRSEEDLQSGMVKSKNEEYSFDLGKQIHEHLENLQQDSREFYDTLCNLTSNEFDCLYFYEAVQSEIENTLNEAAGKPTTHVLPKQLRIPHGQLSDFLQQQPGQANFIANWGSDPKNQRHITPEVQKKIDTATKFVRNRQADAAEQRSQSEFRKNRSVQRIEPIEQPKIGFPELSLSDYGYTGDPADLPETHKKLKEKLVDAHKKHNDLTAELLGRGIEQHSKVQQSQQNLRDIESQHHHMNNPAWLASSKNVGNLMNQLLHQQTLVAKGHTTPRSESSSAVTQDQVEAARKKLSDLQAKTKFKNEAEKILHKEQVTKATKDFRELEKQFKGGQAVSKSSRKTSSEITHATPEDVEVTQSKLTQAQKEHDDLTKAMIDVPHPEVAAARAAHDSLVQGIHTPPKTRKEAADRLHQLKDSEKNLMALRGLHYDFMQGVQQQASNIDSRKQLEKGLGLSTSATERTQAALQQIADQSKPQRSRRGRRDRVAGRSQQTTTVPGLFPTSSSRFKKSKTRIRAEIEGVPRMNTAAELRQFYNRPSNLQPVAGGPQLTDLPGKKTIERLKGAYERATDAFVDAEHPKRVAATKAYTDAIQNRKIYDALSPEQKRQAIKNLRQGVRTGSTKMQPIGRAGRYSLIGSPEDIQRTMQQYNLKAHDPNAPKGSPKRLSPLATLRKRLKQADAKGDWDAVKDIEAQIDVIKNNMQRSAEDIQSAENAPRKASSAETADRPSLAKQIGTAEPKQPKKKSKKGEGRTVKNESYDYVAAAVNKDAMGFADIIRVSLDNIAKENIDDYREMVAQTIGKSEEEIQEQYAIDESISEFQDLLEQLDESQFEEYLNNLTEEELDTVYEILDEAAKRHKPKYGTKKGRHRLAMKIKAGEDIGKPGKNFEDVADEAAKRYGSKETGRRVAAAAMWKSHGGKK